jgi:hypothetical protein
MTFTTTQTILYLIASAIGCTVIVSKGDIFKPFRDWIERLSIKNQVYVHDITFKPTDVVNKVIVDELDTPVAFSDIKSALYHLLQNDIVEIKREEKKKNIRYFIDCKTKHTMSFLLKGEIIEDNCGVYEKHETIKWIDFIHQIFSCPLCLGVYVGFFYYLVFPLRITGIVWFDFLMEGTVVSMASYLYFKAYVFLEKK